MPDRLALATLQSIPLFYGVDQDCLADLAPRIHQQTVSARTALMAAEQPGEVGYVILDGTVKIHAEQADGSDVILAILGPGDLVGELSLLDQHGRSANAVTLTRAHLLWLDRATFEHALQTMPPVAYNLARLLAQRLRLANVQIQLLATQDVYGRVAALLLAFADRYGAVTPDGAVVIALQLTQTDLASLVGASRVRVNQVLGFYRERHYVSIQANAQIAIHDRAALAARCQ